MELIKALPYVISGSICLVIGLILLLMKPPLNSKNTDPLSYNKIKQLIAISAFLDVLVDIITVLGIEKHFDIYLLDYMFIPIVYYMQLGMITYALLGLIHSHLIGKKFWIYIPSSVLALFILYVASYLIFAVNTEDSYHFFDYYRLFVQTSHARFFHIIMLAVTTISMLLCIVTLLVQTKKYDERLVNLHSGRNVTEGRKFEIINYSFIGYFMLAVVDFLFHNDSANTIIILANTAIFVAFFITILDLQDIYFNVSSVKNFDNSFHIQTEKDAEEAPTIKEKIMVWKNSPEKIWLHEGITLTTVAESMKIKPRLLSGYINDILGMNFSKWICTLRIEEAQKMMRENSSVSISEVSFATGFSDASALSRTFKNITGETPSEYKKRVIQLS